jgi:cytosine/adenosine deaminase-related metal-dependent hydrolase
MIIISSKLLTLQRGMRPLNNGAIVFDHGIIKAVGPADDIISKYPLHRIYPLKNVVLMPGLVNLHAHLELPALLANIRSKTFPEWVLSLIQEKKTLTSADYSSAVNRNIDTLKRTGTTTVAEICTHQITPPFLKKSGLRATIFYEIITMDPSSAPHRLKSFGLHPISRLLTYGLSPHAPFTVSESALLQIKKLAENRYRQLSMHVAESKDEIKLLQGKKSGLEKLYKSVGWDKAWAPSADSPFEYLDRLRLLGPDLLAVHAVHATDKDVRLLAKTNTPVAHCPRSNKETRVGKMPLKKFLDSGVTVGLGTDSLASSPSLSMWDEMRYAYQIHRRDSVTAKDIFRLATIGGAKALGLDKEIGMLEPGKKADLIAVPLPLKDTGDIYSDLLRETKSCIMAMVDGKILYQGSRKAI